MSRPPETNAPASRLRQKGVPPSPSGSQPPSRWGFCGEGAGSTQGHQSGGTGTQSLGPRILGTPGEEGLCPPTPLPCHPQLSPSLGRTHVCVQTHGAQTRTGVYNSGGEAHGSQCVRVWVWTHCTPHIYTRTHCAAEAGSRDRRHPGLRYFQRQKLGPLTSHAGSIWFTKLPPEADRKGFSQSDFSLQSSRVRETELFHLLPNDRSPRSWSVSSEEPHPLGGGGGVRGTW